MLDVAAELQPLRADIDRAVARVLDSGCFIGGPEVEGFETELATAAGTRVAVGVSSGTDALLASLMALGVGPGDEVVTTPYTFFATAGAISRVGARPVFADVDDDSLELEPRLAVSAMSERTAALITVHLFGRPAALPEVPVPVLEDAAQSLCATPVRGVCAAVSFFPSKNLGAFGDAGAVLTDDVELAGRLRALRVHGASPKYRHALIGGNFRLDALQAAVLRVKLPHLATWIAARRENAARYRELFANARVPAELRLPGHVPDHVYNQFVIRAPERDRLRTALAQAGVETAVYYPVPLHLQECYRELGYRPGSMPVAERAAEQALALPIYPDLGADRQAYIVQHIAAFYG